MPQDLLVHRLRCVAYHDQPIHQIETVETASSQTLVAVLKDTCINLSLDTVHFHTLHGSYSRMALTRSWLVAAGGDGVLVFCTETWRVVRRLGVVGVWGLAVGMSGKGDKTRGVLVVSGAGVGVYALPKERTTEARNQEESDDEVDDDEHSLSLLKRIPFPHKCIAVTVTRTTTYISTSTSLLFALPLDLHSLLHPSLSTSSLSSSPVKIQLKKKQICWQVLKHGPYILCAMSNGIIDVYSSDNMTYLQGLKGHLADVLCLSGRNKDTFYSSGVDRVVVQWKLVQGENALKWIVAADKRYHSHDVKALKVTKDAILTGGVDQQMVRVSESKFPKGAIKRTCPFGLEGIVVSQGRRVAAAVGGRCDVWEVQDGEEDDSDVDGVAENETKDGQKTSSHKHICEIVLKQSEGLQTITSIALHPSQHILALTTTTSTRLFNISQEVSKIATLPKTDFTHFSVCGTIFAGIEHTTTTTTCILRDLTTLNTLKQLALPTLITGMQISTDLTWLLTQSPTGIQIHNLDTLKLWYELACGVVASCAFQGALVAIACSVGIIVVDVAEKRVVRSEMLDTDDVRGVFWVEQKLVVWGTGFYTDTDEKRKRVKLDEEAEKENENDEKPRRLRVCREYKSVMYMGNLGPDLCIVERPLLTMMQGLPPAFYKKTYGT